MSIIEKRAFHYTPIKTLLFKKTYFYLFFFQLMLLALLYYCAQTSPCSTGLPPTSRVRLYHVGHTSSQRSLKLRTLNKTLNLDGFHPYEICDVVESRKTIM